MEQSVLTIGFIVSTDYSQKLFVGIFTKDETLMKIAVEGIKINLITSTYSWCISSRISLLPI